MSILLLPPPSSVAISCKYTIGKIRIEEKHSFVDFPEDMVEQVLKQSGNYRVGNEKFSLVKA